MKNEREKMEREGDKKNKEKKEREVISQVAPSINTCRLYGLGGGQ